MANWLILVKNDLYDIAKAFDELSEIYWAKRNHFNDHRVQINDIVYLYVNNPDNKIMYKCRVIGYAKNAYLPENDKKYWKKNDAFNLHKQDYIITEGIAKVDKETLSKNYLIQQNLIQAGDRHMSPKTDNPHRRKTKERRKIHEQLFKFITEQFDTEIENFDYPDEANVKSNLFPEGEKQTVQVNRYERNPEARAKCIKINGTRCTICKMSFEETYGTFAKDFIHVHHIIPLYEISESYDVDPETDLIPVCPNCHAMLHRHENGKPIKVEQLKQLYENQKNLSRSQT